MSHYATVKSVARQGLLALCLSAPLIAGCSSYVYRSDVIKASLARDEHADALEEIEKIDKGTSRLLYLYEKGLALHYQDEYVRSNETLEEAELLLEELYTKSITREAVALLVSDTIASYRGESFEAAFVNYYKLLNYIYLGDSEGAVVECRRLNEKLQLIQDAEESEFIDAPFLQYLTGMVYWFAGEFADADVSYRSALNGYTHADSSGQLEVPVFLYCDLATNSRALGDFVASKQYQDLCTSARDSTASTGMLTLFLECGWIAHKTEVQIVVPIFKDELDDEDFETTEFARTLMHRYHGRQHIERKVEYLLKVAIPEMVEPAAPERYAIIRPRERSEFEHVKTVVVENLNLYAARAHAAEQGKVLLRTLVRGIAKYLAKRKVADKDKVLGWLVNAANIATETADTRSWSTLPGRILMGRIQLPPGTYDLEVHVHGDDGVIEELTIPGVEFVAGQASFMNYRVY